MLLNISTSSINIEEVIVLAFGLLGILLGIIFVTDGWRSPSERDSGFLDKSPKLRGLVAIIGGGVIPTVTDFLRILSEGSNDISSNLALSIYTLFVVSTILVGLLVLIVYSFIVAYNALLESGINKNFFKLAIKSLPYVVIAFQSGNDRFKYEIDKISQVSIVLNQQKEISEKQRDSAVSFLIGVFTALVDNNVKHIAGAVNFIRFIEKYFTIFVELFLENSSTLKYHRISLYCRDENDDKLYFVAGINPWNNLHTKDPLSLQDSFAGWALTHPQQVNIWTPSSPNNIPFEKREVTSKYKFIAACAVLPIDSITGATKPKMVLCIDTVKDTIDCLNENSPYRDFTRKMIIFLSIVVATAQSSMEVSEQDLLSESKKSK
ncbi:hypothetical protein [Myxosarcina sp. GI1]|uniref:hypothetical protein n=1 Tax=Myxosarcina sp. GI1 TaxID=1541065 RepID=UPI00055D8090|nr:hypothetical protein [Myxosarcina sp. GI1]